MEHHSSDQLVRKQIARKKREATFDCARAPGANTTQNPESVEKKENEKRKKKQSKTVALVFHFPIE